MSVELLSGISVDLDPRLWPGIIRPTSFSLKFASTQAVWLCTSDNMPSPITAIWPTCRLSAFSITPSIGARTSVRDRSSRALSTAAWAWAICGCSPGAIAAWALAARALRVGEVLLGGPHLIERIVIVGAGGEALLQERLLPDAAHSS